MRGAGGNDEPPRPSQRPPVPRIPSAPWMLSLSLTWFGWGASTTSLGVIAIGMGSAWLLALFAAKRTPARLARFTVLGTLAWLPVFVWHPWLLLVALGLMALAGWWWRRERDRRRALVEAFERRYEADER